MNSEQIGLPTGWAVARLGDLYDFEYGKALTKASRVKNGKYPVFGSSGQVGVHDDFLVRGPVIIIGRKGAAGTVNYSAQNVWPIDTTYFVRNVDQLCLKFSYYLFKSLRFEKLEASTAIPGLSRQLAYNEVVLLPPLAEQKRIVAKIEELYSELDKGVESLKTAQAQLKVYRQALLKQAFEGKLTEKWRAENQDKLESADELLVRIQRARDERYRNQIADRKLSEESKPKVPMVIQMPKWGELVGLPPLPTGWAWFSIGSISNVSGGLTKNPIRAGFPLKRPFLRVANVYANRLELNDMHETGVSPVELPRVELAKGDILIVEGNGSVDQIGRVALWAGSIEGCVHQNHLIKSRTLDLMDPEFVLYFLMSELGRKFIVRAASSTSGLHTLSISKIEGLYVPVCAIDEQRTLLQDLSLRLSEIDHLEAVILTGLQQADALRQSILKEAFSGKLVPQDPSDEPVPKLLERIKADRAANIGNETKSRRAKSQAA